MPVRFMCARVCVCAPLMHVENVRRFMYVCMRVCVCLQIVGERLALQGSVKAPGHCQTTCTVPKPPTRKEQARERPGGHAAHVGVGLQVRLVVEGNAEPVFIVKCKSW